MITDQHSFKHQAPTLKIPAAKNKRQLPTGKRQNLDQCIQKPNVVRPEQSPTQGLGPRFGPKLSVSLNVPKEMQLIADMDPWIHGSAAGAAAGAAASAAAVCILSRTSRETRSALPRLTYYRI